MRVRPRNKSEQTKLASNSSSLFFPFLSVFLLNSTHEFGARKDTLTANALNWVRLNLREFDPTTHKVNQNLRLKALSELLFMSSLYKRRFKTMRPPMDGFVAYGVEVIRRMTYVDGIHRKPELVLPYSIMYKSLRECGLEAEILKGVIQSMLDIGLPMATEDNPYRKMELRYALENGRFNHLPPPIQTLFRNTSLNTSLRDTPPVLSFRLENIYGLTHVVFYLTDFGFSTKSNIPNIASLRWLVSTMLGVQTLERNWDTVAELLMCCSFLNYFPSPLYLQAWTALFKAQKSNGSLTDNFFDVKKFDSMDVAEKGRYYFEQHYHTTLVCAAAAFLTDDRSLKKTDAFYTIHGYPTPNCATHLARAREWVLRTYTDRSGRLGLSSLLYILVGEWVASVVAGDWHRERSRSLYLRIHSEMQRVIRSDSTSVGACDPALVLLGEGILRKFRLRVPDFELLASKSADALKDNESVNQRLSLFPVMHLLESLGFEVNARPGRDQKQELTTVYESELSGERLHDLANYISKATSFGYYGFRAESSQVDKIRGDLAALTFYHLHHYQLEDALLLIRAMNHAGMSSSKTFEEGVDFMLAQQRDDGSFGFYADEIELIRKSDPGLDPIEKLTLPVTISAVWTMSEATKGGFSLFNSIRTPRLRDKDDQLASRAFR